MLIEQTLDKLNAMKLTAMADAWRQQIQTDEAAVLSFDERLGLLVDAEWTAREQRKLERRLRTAKLRYPATLEAVDFTHPRRLNRQQILTLGACAWIAERHRAARRGHPALTARHRYRRSRHAARRGQRCCPAAGLRRATLSVRRGAGHPALGQEPDRDAPSGHP